MISETITAEKILFEEEVGLTAIHEFGFSWTDFVNGKPVPPEGARFDIAFEGRVSGDRLSGTVSGVDYLEVRSDGKLLLNLQATLTTRDGERIKLTETGINDNGELRLNMHFHTASSQYRWLNKLQVWGIGRVDFASGRVHIKGLLI